MEFTTFYQQASETLIDMGAKVVRTFSDHVAVEVDGNPFNIWVTGAVTQPGNTEDLNYACSPDKLCEKIRGIVGE